VGIKNIDSKRGFLKSDLERHSEFISESHHTSCQFDEKLKQVQFDENKPFK
jgi:hypothetical protein